MGHDRAHRRRVVVVTGGGGGIGAAIAEDLGRAGAFVVTMDPLVSLDGTEPLPAPEQTTAGRIVASGGAARASSVSVTDREGVHSLFARLVDEHGRLDAVVNVAGITRPTSFAEGTDDDWRDVLAVHLDGYRNILDAALPIMAAAGYGRVLGVTSGSGWRPADTGAYGCAKRAVAALTWQLGRHAPPGVVVNAMSPIAVTRMVTAALGRAGAERGPGPSPSATGGLSLGSMPSPEQIGPLGAHLVGVDFSWCSGQVIFAGGSEMAVVDAPRLLEVLGTDHITSLPHALEAVTSRAFVPAEARQVTKGGSNPRFGSIFGDAPTPDLPAPLVRSCAVIVDSPKVAAAITASLDARGVASSVVADVGSVASFASASSALNSAIERDGPVDAVIVSQADGSRQGGEATDWERILAEHAGVVEQLHADASWVRAVADLSARVETPMRLVMLTDATTAGGRTRAQAAAQLARAARGATHDRMTAFAVGVETMDGSMTGPIADLAVHLLCSSEATDLSGAELVAGGGWIGLRSHPQPGTSISFGGPAIPGWLDDVLRDTLA